MATPTISSLEDEPVVQSSLPTTAEAECAKDGVVQGECAPVIGSSTPEESSSDEEILTLVKEQKEDEPQEEARDDYDEGVVPSVKPDDGDEEQGLVPTRTTPPTSFRQTCRFVTRLGLAAYAYGSPSFRVEAFVRSLLIEQYGFPAHQQMFAITNTECMTAFCETEDDDPILMMQPLRRQTLNLYRLGRISAIAKSLRADDEADMTLARALAELAAVEQAPDPFGPIALFVSYIAIGGGLAALFQGSWADVFASLVCSIPVCGITMVVPPALAKASLFGSAAVSAALATLAADYLPLLPEDATTTIHTGIVVLSSIAVLLPGYAATLAVSELVSHHIVCGLDRFVHAIFDMLLLFAGAWSGAALLGGGLGTFASASSEPLNNIDDDTSTPLDWLGWIVPVLLISLAVQFQTSLRDFAWVLLHLAVAFCTVFFLGNDATNDEDEASSSSTANRSNRLWSGVFVAALSTTALAQLWSRWFDRPRSIVLVPCMVLLVSGSIGFRGLVTLSSGGAGGAPRDPDESESSVAEGLQQVLQMFLITFLILGGVTVGSVVVPTQTTL